VVKIIGVLIEKEDTEGLPVFDILLSGNESVLSWADSLGLTSEFVDRSDGYLFSGTEIRDELRNS